MTRRGPGTADAGQQLQLRLQQATSDRQKADQQASEITKKQSDASSSIIDNLK